MSEKTPSGASEEIADIINPYNEVIGQASLARIHAEGLLHRTAGGLVLRRYRKKVEALLQQREDNGKWTFSGSGHENTKETAAEAQSRELDEELRIIVDKNDWVPLLLDHYRSNGHEYAKPHDRLNAIGAVLLPDVSLAEAKRKFNRKEVRNVQYVDLSLLLGKMHATPEKFAGVFVHGLRKVIRRQALKVLGIEI